VKIKTVIVGAVGSGRNGRACSTGSSDRGVGIRFQKGDIRIGKAGDRKPYMVDTGGCTGRVDPNCPDSGTGILKAQKNQLTAGSVLD